MIGMRAISARIDKILDACKLDRYMFIGQNGLQPYAFTKHSPVGPLFLQPIESAPVALMALGRTQPIETAPAAVDQIEVPALR